MLVIKKSTNNLDLPNNLLYYVLNETMKGGNCVKLYLDDIRNPHQSGYQDSEWIVCKNDKTFKDMFMSFDSIVTHISFDHDIDSYNDDGTEVTGYDCVKWLCYYILDNNLDISNLTLNFHTANPVGKENMETYWKNFRNYYCVTYLKE